jgi:transporter family-2 protein
MIIVLVIIAVIVGSLMPVQAGINAQLTQALKNPFLGALVSFMMGTVALLILSVTQSASFGELKRIPSLPPYMLLGGLMGATFVGASIALIPKLGATTMIAAFVTGQLLMSLVIDHYGFLGLAHHPINLIRLAGVVLLFVGLILILKF